MRDKNWYFRRQQYRLSNAAENEFPPHGVRVTAHHQQIIMSILDLLLERRVFFSGRDLENVPVDVDFVIS